MTLRLSCVRADSPPEKLHCRVRWSELRSFLAAAQRLDADPDAEEPTRRALKATVEESESSLAQTPKYTSQRNRKNNNESAALCDCCVVAFPTAN